MEEVVRLDDVHKWFGSHHVLKGVNMSVNAGGVVAIIGQSGSGKSTALRCIDHLEVIDKGEISVCGRSFGPEISHKNLKQLRRDIGIVFQSYNLFPHLTAEQNITLALKSVQKLQKTEAKDIAADVLNQVGLGDKAELYPEQLSGGQQQRVAIARSLAMNPKLMLFDEVTSALDPQLTRDVLKVIERLAMNGMTMVLVTHEMSFAVAAASEVIFMYQGKVHECGEPQILRNPSTPELKEFIGNEPIAG